MITRISRDHCVAFSTREICVHSSSSVTMHPNITQLIKWKPAIKNENINRKKTHFKKSNPRKKYTRKKLIKLK